MVPSASGRQPLQRDDRAQSALHLRRIPGRRHRREHPARDGFPPHAAAAGEKEIEVPYERADVNFCGDCVYFTQRHFVDRMLDGKAFETSGEEYLKTLTVQEAVYESAAQRTPVNL